MLDTETLSAFGREIEAICARMSDAVPLAPEAEAALANFDAFVTEIEAEKAAAALGELTEAEIERLEALEATPADVGHSSKTHRAGTRIGCALNARILWGCDYRQRVRPKVAFSGTFPHPSRTPLSAFSLPANDNPIPDWKRASDMGRLTALYVAANRMEGCKAWPISFNPSPEENEAALRDPHGYGSHFKERARYHLRQAGIDTNAVVIVAQLEPENGRLHVHGIAVVNSNVNPLDLHAPLLAAAGVDPKTPGAEHQTYVELDGLFNPAGWAWYCLRNQRNTIEAISGRRVYSVYGDISSAARAAYTERRREVIASRRKPSTSCGCESVSVRRPNTREGQHLPAARYGDFFAINSNRL